MREILRGYRAKDCLGMYLAPARHIFERGSALKGKKDACEGGRLRGTLL